MNDRRRPVLGWEGLYEVSSDGLVFSLDRSVTCGTGRFMKPGRPLTASVNSRGYLCVSLSKDGRKKTFSVHRIVAQAFLPNPLGLREVNHIDGNRTNPQVANLEWCTATENRLHAYHVSRSFTMPPRGKLDYETAERIRAEHPVAGTQALAMRYRVDPSAIRNIVRRATYREPPRDISPVQGPTP